jgi:hypothetical protein
VEEPVRINERGQQQRAEGRWTIRRGEPRGRQLQQLARVSDRHIESSHNKPPQCGPMRPSSQEPSRGLRAPSCGGWRGAGWRSDFNPQDAVEKRSPESRQHPLVLTCWSGGGKRAAHSIHYLSAGINASNARIIGKRLLLTVLAVVRRKEYGTRDLNSSRALCYGIWAIFWYVGPVAFHFRTRRDETVS